MKTQTSSASFCAETSYTAPKGLQFSLYCDQDRTSVGDIDNAGADTVEDCLKQCSLHAGKACGAAAFDSTARKCYFKKSTITEVGAVTREGWILGVANRTQYQSLSTECSNNGGSQSAQNGLNFTVHCNQTVNGFDVCPDDSPECRVHAESLDKCLDVCSTLHPLCTGVAWDPSLQFGYLNCYPKNATARVFDNARVAAGGGGGLRCAKALLDVPTDDCATAVGGTVEASNTDSFKLLCGEDRPGHNLTTQHASSLRDCVDTCATYTQANCVGAVFDTNMINGYENCYLKSLVGLTTSQSGFTFALRQTNSINSNNSKPPSSDKSSSSKAWIASPVISAIVALSLILAAIWWFRKRKVSKKEVENTGNSSTQNRWLGHETNSANALKYGPVRSELDDANAAMKYEVGSGVHDANTPKYELDPENRPIEMDSTMKNGVVDGRGMGRV